MSVTETETYWLMLSMVVHAYIESRTGRSHFVREFSVFRSLEFESFHLSLCGVFELLYVHSSILLIPLLMHLISPRSFVRSFCFCFVLVFLHEFNKLFILFSYQTALQKKFICLKIAKQ